MRKKFEYKRLRPKKQKPAPVIPVINTPPGKMAVEMFNPENPKRKLYEFINESYFYTLRAFTDLNSLDENLQRYARNETKIDCFQDNIEIFEENIKEIISAACKVFLEKNKKDHFKINK